ncbi:IS3 family transposase [Thermodesulfobacteriota bacterium]
MVPCKRGPSPRLMDNEKLLPIVRAAHRLSKGTYGTRRIADEVKACGTACGRFRAGTLMKLAGIVAKQKRKFKATTDSKHNLPVAPNLLNRQFKVKEPDRVYVSDITYIWTTKGWLYLAVILDLFSRQVVGWSLNKRMTRKLIKDALLIAVWRRRPAPGLIFHSDRGSQYCSKDFQKMLKTHKMKSSMSRKGDCWERAACPWGTMRWQRVFWVA